MALRRALEDVTHQSGAASKKLEKRGKKGKEMMAILVASNVGSLDNDCSRGMKEVSQTPVDKKGFSNQLYSRFSLEAASGWNPIQTAIKEPKHLSGPGPVGGRESLQNGAEQQRKRWVGGCCCCCCCRRTACFEHWNTQYWKTGSRLVNDHCV